MIRIAIVDDEKEERERLLYFFDQIQTKMQDVLEIELFPSGEQFISDSGKHYDLICLDIDMDGRDGIETAKEIRKSDAEVIIIFITNMAQMAIRGYEVHALDFILKPVNFYSFAMKIQNAFSIIQNKKSKYILVTTASGITKLSSNDLLYAEVNGHYMYYHTSAAIYKQKASMKDLEEKLVGLSFKRCNNCYLVNLKYVDGVDKDDLMIQGERLKISRPRKREFLQALANYLGGITI